ncbi:hypothetical protein [Streptomyces anulatus]|uniref:hypothetical protein n=1 Tax=Streptomyces anulatus TaxID=1892 RepID=UPI00386F89BF
MSTLPSLVSPVPVSALWSLPPALVSVPWSAWSAPPEPPASFADAVGPACLLPDA